MAFLRRQVGTATTRTEKDLTLTTPALGTPSAGVVTNFSGVLPSGVTGGSGLTALGTVTSGSIAHVDIKYPAGHVIKWQRYATTTSQDYNGTSESVYTPLGNPVAFVKLRDQDESKLSFLLNGRMFDEASDDISLAINLKLGTDTTGTQVGVTDVYDLNHSYSTPNRTGRSWNMQNLADVTNQDAGTINFVLTCNRNAYSEPQALSSATLDIFEIMV